eukprot:GDKJ01049367.1.p1 GENE.GDKJ01049367.1~~GDKJ01049367.1.p1  ORF type:complete len:2039 (-),score=678.56 GDKJ01049367.1:442-6558(-)
MIFGDSDATLYMGLMIDSNGVVVTDVNKATIRFLSPEEIRKQSVVQVNTIDVWDNLNNPIEGGLHDTRMGPVSTMSHQTCGTCGLGSDCPGHIGHIELAAPAYHPVLLPHLIKLLKCVCFRCKRLRMHAEDARKFMLLFRLLSVENLSDMQLYEMLTGPIISDTKTTKEGEVSLATEVQNARRALMKQVRARLNSAETFLKQSHKDKIQEHLIKQDLEKILSDEELSKIPSIYPPLAGDNECVPVDSVGAFSSTKVEMWNELQKRFYLEAAKKKCNYCDFDQSVTVRRNKDHSRIVVQWGATLSSPFNDESFTLDAESADEEEENEKQQERKEATLTLLQTFGSSKVDDAIQGRRRVKKRELFARDVETLVHQVFHTDKAILQTLIPSLARSGPGLFFMKAVAVPSNRFRPLQRSVMPGGMSGSARGPSLALLHPRTSSLLNLLNASKDFENVLKAEVEAARKEQLATVQQVKKERTEREKQIADSLAGLQLAVNTYLDRTKAQKPDECPPGVRQLLERKQGLFRMKMMGKRVNFAARSVISPDPSINTNEIGMPIHFAMTLTFPEPVTTFNVEWLRTLVINGPEKYPGAQAVKERSGRRKDLSYLDEEQRIALANSIVPLSAADIAAGFSQPIVYRHAKDNDLVLMNRQPTLHKPSIMAHRVRVLTGQRTIRMHYANCNTFNADFDGDEMNMHLLQDPLGRAEAAVILNADAQYQVPKDGSPLRGLIQDHCGAGAILTSRNTFLNKVQYEQLVFVGLHRFLDDQGKNNAPLTNNNGSLTKIILKTGVKRVHLEIPAVIKPKELYTGKQVMTTIIKTITEAVASEVLHLLPKRLAGANDRCFAGLYYQGKSRVPGDAWKASEDGNQEEAQVLIEGGELLRGVLDKNQFGSSSNGIIHICHEILGPRASGGLLSAFGRVFSEYFRMRGFTCAASDLFLDEEGERQRENIIRTIHLASARNLALFAATFAPEESVSVSSGTHSGDLMIADAEGADKGSRDGSKYNLTAKEVAARGPILDAYVTEGVRKIFATRAKSPEAYVKMLDTLYKSVISKHSSQGADLCKGSRMLRPFPQNGFATMVTTGAKGSKVNFGMICAFLAQQELEGKRVPMMASGKTLPSFAAYDLSARPGGFISDRYLNGLRPQEFFFHCMSGREGLVDTAVKTARSGYLQRCIIKGMEGMTVKYDGSVRDSDGLVVQFQYGEDGLDTIKQSSLDVMPDILRNFSSIAARHRDAISNPHISNGLAAAIALENGGKPDPKRCILPPKSHGKGSDRDPVASTYITQQTAGVVTEAFLEKVKTFVAKELKNGTIRSDDSPDEIEETVVVEEKADEASKKSKKSKTTTTVVKKIDHRPTVSAFELLMRLRFQSALADAGEAVGVSAGQSIGEPSTQMTLNTFHLAGHGAANVTLGIPRLRELLQTSSQNMGTPMTTIAIRAADSKDVEAARAQIVCKHLRKVTLFELVESLKVHTRRVRYSSSSEEFHEYEVEATMVDMNLIKKALPGLSPQKIVACLKGAFTTEVLSKLYAQLIKVATRAELNGARATLGEEMDDTEAAAARALSGALDSKSLRGVQLNKLLSNYHLQVSGKSRYENEAHVDSMMEGDVKPLEPISQLAVDEEGNPLLALAMSEKVAAAEGVESEDETNDSEESSSSDDDDEEAAAARVNSALFGDDDESEDEDGNIKKKSKKYQMDEEDSNRRSKKFRAALDDEEAGSDIEGSDESEDEFDDDERAVDGEDSGDDDEYVGDEAGARAAKNGKRSRTYGSKVTSESLVDDMIAKKVEIKSKSGRFLRSTEWDAKNRRFTLVMAHPVDKLVSKPVLVTDVIRKIAMTLPVQAVRSLSGPQIVTHSDIKKSATGSHTEVRVNGCNFRGLASLPHEIVDHNKISSNDIFSISLFFGIEAARAVFVREMASVFGHYGITVDFRHLYLIGDAMTRGGKFRPFNRAGMTSHSSPFLQMTYETSTKFLGDCSMRAAVDDLNTPAGSIIAGRVARVGTGVFDVMGCVSKSSAKSAAAAAVVKDGQEVKAEKRKIKFTASA